MDADRRTFLKGAAMAAASAAVTGRDQALALPVVDASNAGGTIEWNKAPCRFCGTGCHVQVGVEEGRVVAVAGDKHADVNKGLLCVKGYHVGAILYGQDRLTQPLLRKGDSYVAISWDEAIDVVAQRIMQAPEKFAFYGSGQ
jgi:nitrate reductase NapA